LGTSSLGNGLVKQINQFWRLTRKVDRQTFKEEKSLHPRKKRGSMDSRKKGLTYRKGFVVGRTRKDAGETEVGVERLKRK